MFRWNCIELTVSLKRGKLKFPAVDARHQLPFKAKSAGKWIPAARKASLADYPSGDQKKRVNGRPDEHRGQELLRVRRLRAAVQRRRERAPSVATTTAVIVAGTARDCVVSSQRRIAGASGAVPVQGLEEGGAPAEAAGRAARAGSERLQEGVHGAAPRASDGPKPVERAGCDAGRRAS
jgi:hypothetical protein